jgi:hypothetical protein
MVTANGDSPVLTAAKPAMTPSPLLVLLVGNKEEDFFLIREIVERTHSTLTAELEHAHSLDEAKAMMQQQPYGLLRFEHATGGAEAVHSVAEFLHAGTAIPSSCSPKMRTNRRSQISSGQAHGTGCLSRNWMGQP